MNCYEAPFGFPFTCDSMGLCKVYQCLSLFARLRIGLAFHVIKYKLKIHWFVFEFSLENEFKMTGRKGTLQQYCEDLSISTKNVGLGVNQETLANTSQEFTCRDC